MKYCLSLLLCCGMLESVRAQSYERDEIATSGGTLAITFLGHASLMIEYAGKVIHVDPYGDVADYSRLPKADLVLVTHDHFDHLDVTALNRGLKDGTVVIGNRAVAARVRGAIAMTNGEVRTEMGLKIEAVPAYNVVHMAAPGRPFHPKGQGNGYVVGFGDKRVYIAGDTENIPEMKVLKNIDVAFLPMNLPYTMTPEMVADAARAFKPKILYPYHFGDTDTRNLVQLLESEPGIEVRIRRMP